MDSEKNGPISLKSLRFKTNILTATVIALIAIVLTIVALKVYESYNPPVVVPTSAAQITLKEVIIAYSPETKNIIFLDRATNQVKLVLENNVTQAIFVLQSSGVTYDYKTSLINKDKDGKK